MPLDQWLPASTVAALLAATGCWPSAAPTPAAPAAPQAAAGEAPEQPGSAPSNEEPAAGPNVEAAAATAGAAESGPPAGEVREFSDLKIKFCWCPPGSFTMGSPADEAKREEDEDDTPDGGGEPVAVTLTQGFWLGQFEVTQAQWKAVLDSNPSYFVAGSEGGDRVSQFDTDSFPVEWLSWFDAIEFCNGLSARDGLAPSYELVVTERAEGHIESASVTLLGGNGYRLPTEAEWEYACRAGTTTSYNHGGVSDGSQANTNGELPYGTTTSGVYLHRTTTVGSYEPNAWGLHDMHGNASEWCFDSYNDRLRGGTDPIADSGYQRVLRGGDYQDNARTRSAARIALAYNNRMAGTGLRLARSP
jgi:formylglycine-generating enzyme required for sulfatase activity